MQLMKKEITVYLSKQTVCREGRLSTVQRRGHVAGRINNFITRLYPRLYNTGHHSFARTRGTRGKTRRGVREGSPKDVVPRRAKDVVHQKNLEIGGTSILARFTSGKAAPASPKNFGGKDNFVR